MSGTAIEMCLSPHSCRTARDAVAQVLDVEQQQAVGMVNLTRKTCPWVQ